MRDFDRNGGDKPITALEDNVADGETCSVDGRGLNRHSDYFHSSLARERGCCTIVLLGSTREIAAFLSCGFPEPVAILPIQAELNQRRENFGGAEKRDTLQLGEDAAVP